MTQVKRETRVVDLEARGIRKEFREWSPATRKPPWVFRAVKYTHYLPLPGVPELTPHVLIEFRRVSCPGGGFYKEEPPLTVTFAEISSERIPLVELINRLLSVASAD